MLSSGILCPSARKTPADKLANYAKYRGANKSVAAANRQRRPRRRSRASRHPPCRGLENFPAAAVIEARRCGIGDFGENYAQEAEAKIAIVAARGGGVGLAFRRRNPKKQSQNYRRQIRLGARDRQPRVGRKTFARARRDRLAAVADLLASQYRRRKSKAGVAPAAVADLARAICGLPHLRLRGLTAIPAPRETDARGGRRFAPSPILRRQIAATGDRTRFAVDGHERRF